VKAFRHCVKKEQLQSAIWYYRCPQCVVTDWQYSKRSV